MKKNQIQSGDHVYVICRNPHAASVAMIQEAEVIENPEKNGDKALLLNDFCYEFAEDDAVFPTFEEAQLIYRQIYDED